MIIVLFMIYNLLSRSISHVFPQQIVDNQLEVKPCKILNCMYHIYPNNSALPKSSPPPEKFLNHDNLMNIS